MATLLLVLNPGSGTSLSLLLFSRYVLVSQDCVFCVCVYMCAMSLWVSVCLCAFACVLCICMSVYMCVFVLVPVSLCACLCVAVFVYVCMCVSVSLFLYLSLCPYVCVCFDGHQIQKFPQLGKPSATEFLLQIIILLFFLIKEKSVRLLSLIFNLLKSSNIHKKEVKKFFPKTFICCFQNIKF